MRGEWLWDGEKIPFPHDEPRQVLYVGQGWESHVQKVVEPELERLWPKHWGKVGDCTKKNNQGVKAQWTDPGTKSQLHIASNNQESSSFEGDQYDLIIWDEPPKRENRVAAARGLVDRAGRELFVATLLNEAWLHREVIKKRLDGGAPDPSVFHIDGEIYDNVSQCGCGEFILRLVKMESGEFWGVCPKCGNVKDFVKRGLTIDGVNQFSKTLKKEEIDARIKGKPSYLSTLVLPRFDRNVHVKPRFKVPLNWIVDVSIDFHPSKPWAVLFVATSPNGFKYAVDYLHEKGNPKYIAEEILRRAHDRHYFLNSPITIDPLAKGDENAHDDAQTVFRIMERVFSSHGLTLISASKDKENGISMINNLLMTENEMPALFFFDDLGIVLEEIEDWMYDKETLKPSKTDDEFCELLYRIMLRDTKWRDPQESKDTFFRDEEPYDPLGRTHQYARAM